MPGAVKPLTSPYGNKPGSLPTQTPNAGLEADLGTANAQAAAGLKPTPAQAPQAGAPVDLNAEADSLFQQMDAPGEAGGFTPPQPGDQFQPEPGFMQAQMQQFQDFKTRFVTGLASNDTEAMGYLKNKLGADNVRWKDGKAFVRNKMGEKFHALDPKQLEIFTDLLPVDWSRGVVQEAVALPAEAAGGAVAGPGGATAGRVLSGPAQIAAADKAAELAGVPQDPSRNKAMEMGIQSVLEGTLPLAGKFVSRYIPGTKAYNMAKAAGEKELTALSHQSQEVARAVGELAHMDQAVYVDGSIVGVPGGRVSLAAHQLNPESAMIRRLQEQAVEAPAFVNTMRTHAEEWGKLFDGTMKELANREGKGVLAPDMLAKRVVDGVNNVRKLEGENIAKYKAQALATLGGKPQQLTPEVIGHLQTIVNNLEFTPKGAPASREELQKLVGQFGITSTGEARAIVNNVNDILMGLQKDGGLNIKDMDRYRNSIGDLADKMRGTPAGRQMGLLSSAMRENYKQVIESGIPNEFEKHGFRSAMEDYSVIMDNVDTLRSALNENSSAKAIVDKFFTGKENIPRMRAIKAMDGEAFDNLRAEWINQQLVKFQSREMPTGVAAGQMMDKLEKQYGPEFMNEVFPKQEQRTVKNMLTVLDRINTTFKEGKVDSATERYKQGAVNTLIGVIGNVKFKTLNGIAAFMRGKSGAEHAAIQLLSRDGIDKYVANYPGKVDKAELSQKLKDFVAAYRVHRIVDSPVTKSAARGAAKKTLGYESGDATAPTQ